MASTTGSKIKQLMKKYGKVGLGVHLSISAASITGLYIAIKNNVDVESLLQKLSFGTATVDEPPPSTADQDNKRNRTAELAASSGGAFALALLCNKALFPIRVPITVAITPTVAKFLARRNLVKI